MYDVMRQYISEYFNLHMCSMMRLFPCRKNVRDIHANFEKHAGILEQLLVCLENMTKENQDMYVENVVRKLQGRPGDPDVSGADCCAPVDFRAWMRDMGTTFVRSIPNLPDYDSQDYHELICYYYHPRISACIETLRSFLDDRGETLPQVVDDILEQRYKAVEDHWIDVGYPVTEEFEKEHQPLWKAAQSAWEALRKLPLKCVLDDEEECAGRKAADAFSGFSGEDEPEEEPVQLDVVVGWDADWAEIDLADLGGKSKPAMSQIIIDAFNVVTKDAPENAEEALVKLLDLSLAVNDHCTTDKRVFHGLNEAANGASVFYLPVYVYYPTPWEDYRQDIWAAYEAQDRESLRNQYEKELYDYMDDWLTNGNDSGQRGTSWGMYKSRLEKNMGIALGLKARETGFYEPNYFYGAATRTEQRAGSTLSDITTGFVIDYITGQKTEADWEDFKQTWNDLGGDSWTKEVNKQYTDIAGFFFIYTDYFCQTIFYTPVLPLLYKNGIIASTERVYGNVLLQPRKMRKR